MSEIASRDTPYLHFAETVSRGAIAALTSFTWPNEAAGTGRKFGGAGAESAATFRVMGRAAERRSARRAAAGGAATGRYEAGRRRRRGRFAQITEVSGCGSSARLPESGADARPVVSAGRRPESLAAAADRYPVRPQLFQRQQLERDMSEPE